MGPKNATWDQGPGQREQQLLEKDLAPSPTGTACVAVIFQEKALCVCGSHGICDAMSLLYNYGRYCTFFP